MTKPGRNAPCPCGSGLKYKRCCEEKDSIAEANSLFESFDAHDQAEIMIYDIVRNSILTGLWFALNGPSASQPGVGRLEEFYQEIYGYELDDTLVEEIVFPLSTEARTRIIAAHALKDSKVVDIEPGPASLPADLEDQAGA